jgi:hypothetical protein
MSWATAESAGCDGRCSMRKGVVAAVFCVAILVSVAAAQMRGGFGGGFRGGVSFGGPRVATVHSWGVAPVFRGHVGKFGDFGFNIGRFPGVCTPFAGCFRPSFFGVPFAGTGFLDQRFFDHGRGFDRDFDHRSGFNAIFDGYAGPYYGGESYYGYGMPFYLDQTSYASQQQYDEAQLADRERMLNDLDFERRRQMELQQQLADLQAAQEASKRAPRQPVQATPSPAPAPPKPTVLVFRDGHQIQVDNYIMTANRLFALGPERKQTIELSELDLNATVKANQDRGVRFAVPKSSQAQK